MSKHTPAPMKPDNPSAFPSPDTYHPNGQVEYGSPGMTLRDYFAGQFIIALMSNNIDPTKSHYLDNPNERRLDDWVCENAYVYADRMLLARTKEAL
jgi:hypothetical protein